MTSGDILLKVAQAFEHAALRWCILHGYQQFPQHVPSDVDIVLAKQDLAVISKLLLQIPGVRLVQSINYQPGSCYYVLHSLECVHAMLKLDISTDLITVRRCWMSGEEFLVNRMQFRNLFWVPPPSLEFIAYLLKKITKAWQFGKNSFQENHTEYLSSLFLIDERACTVQLSRFFSEQDFSILYAAAKTGSWQVAIEKSREIARRLLARKKSLTDRAYWRYCLLETQRWLARCRAPTGIVVAVLGPDGAGKTAVIKHIKSLLAPAFRRTACMHLRPHFGTKKKHEVTVNNPHGKPPRATCASSLKIGWWLVDYTVGYFFSVYLGTVRSTLIVFDRYFYDLFVDPIRYRFAGPWPFVQWVARFIPTPDVIIILDAPEHVLLQRKSEVEKDELKRQRKAYLHLADQYQNAYVVDATHSINDIAALIGDLVLQHMEQRLVLRLSLAKA